MAETEMDEISQQEANWAELKFSIIRFSSEDKEHKADELIAQSYHTKGWQSQRFASYPQELILELGGVCRVFRMQFLSHQSKISKRIDLHISSHSALDGAEFERIGFFKLQNNEQSNHEARELKTVFLPEDTIGRFIKIKLGSPFRNTRNSGFQVGLIAITISGEQLNENESSQPKTQANTAIVSHNNLAISSGENEGITEEEITEGIKRLNLSKNFYKQVDDNDAAERIQEKIDELKKLGLMLSDLSYRKMKAVEVEDYDLAKLLKAEAQDIRVKRASKLLDEVNEEFSGGHTGSSLASPGRKSNSQQNRRGRAGSPRIQFDLRNSEMKVDSPITPIGKVDTPFGTMNEVPSTPTRKSLSKSNSNTKKNNKSGGASSGSSYGWLFGRKTNDAAITETPASPVSLPNFAAMGVNPPSDSFDPNSPNNSTNPYDEIPINSKYHQQQLQSLSLPSSPSTSDYTKVPPIPIVASPTHSLRSKKGDERSNSKSARNGAAPAIFVTSSPKGKKHIPIVEETLIEQNSVENEIEGKDVGAANYLKQVFNENSVVQFFSKNHPIREEATKYFISKIEGDNAKRKKIQDEQEFFNLLKTYKVAMMYPVQDKILKVYIHSSSLLNAIIAFIEANAPKEDHCIEECRTTMRPVLVAFCRRVGEGAAKIQSIAAEALHAAAKCKFLGAGAVWDALHSVCPTQPKPLVNWLLFVTTIIRAHQCISPPNSGIPLQALWKVCKRGLMHANDQVRKAATGVMLMVNSIVGDALQLSVLIDELPPQQKQAILNEFNDTVIEKNKQFPMGGPSADALELSTPPFTCEFCLAVDPLFTEHGLEQHWASNCVMLMNCPFCDYIIEVMSATDHFLRECYRKEAFEMCTRCHSFVAKNRARHHQMKECDGIIPAEPRKQCYYCRKLIKIDSLDGWRKHLMVQCKLNTRRP